MISHINDTGYLSQENSTQPDDNLDSKAVFAIYRPELRHIQDPYTYDEAQRKYRRQGDPKMEEYARSLRNRVNIRRMAPNKATLNTKLYLPKKRSKSKRKSPHGGIGGYSNSIDGYLTNGDTINQHKQSIQTHDSQLPTQADKSSYNAN